MMSKAPGLRLTARALRAAPGSLKQLGSRGFAEKAGEGSREQGGENTYESIKKVASQSGDPVKEWIQGSKEHASSSSQTAEDMYEATRRATQDITTHSKEALQKSGLKDVKQMAGDASKGGRVVQGMAAAGAKISEAAHRQAGASRGASSSVGRVGEAVKEAVGGGAQDLPSARAQFEASRSEEQRAALNKDRKSQLTDEAVGDNPAEQRTRDEHQILPSDFYTKH